MAFLYIDSDSNSGATRTNATVSWSEDKVSPLDGFAEESAITAIFNAPGKNVVVKIHMSRNVEETLSASHIIDLKFEVPANFAHGSVDSVIRFVMKNREEARGEPLVAVPIKVRENHFLIVLDKVAQAVEQNQQLLLNSNWIDINVAFVDGHRGLLTLSKGKKGDAVFLSAFNDWANRD